MAWTTVYSPAKINLFLEVVARRDDGFHDLDTFMVRAGLCDRLSFRLSGDEQVRLVVRPPPGARDPLDSIPLDHRNLIWRAIDALGHRMGRNIGLDVVLEKQIPVSAGFGGGSGNAVTTLVAVNRLMRFGLDEPELREIANTLGSDLAFFFAPASARCTGRGEIVEAGSGFRRLWVVMAMPPEGLVTARVFANCRPPDRPLDGRWFTSRWPTASLAELGARLHNRLEVTARSLDPWPELLRRQFTRVGCRAHQMSGSGSGWFGLFAHRREALRAASALRARIPQARFFCVATTREMAGAARQ